MPNFAVVDSNYVSNVIVADSQEVAEAISGRQCIDITGIEVGIGDSWNGTQFIKKEIPNAEV